MELWSNDLYLWGEAQIVAIEGVGLVLETRKKYKGRKEKSGPQMALAVPKVYDF